MSRAFLFAILCIAATLHSVSGTAQLIPKLSSASCSGHLKDIKLTSITCDYSNTGCTYGSEVFVTGTVSSDADLPRPMLVNVDITFPHIYSVGRQVFSTKVDDICETGQLTTDPDGTDDAPSCPGAGDYTFNFLYQNSGTRESWYAGWSGYGYGMVLHMKHEQGGSDYGTCHIDIHAAHGEDDSYATNATYVAATLGLAGVCLNMFMKRRKERVPSDDESEERTKDLATNFELVQDSASTFV